MTIGRLLIVVGTIALALQAQAQTARRTINPCFDAGVKKSVAFLGYFLPSKDPAVDPERVYTGTGFLVQLDDQYYLVTARHVVDGFRKQFPQGEVPLIAFVNDKTGALAYMSLAELQSTFATTWIVSAGSDVAMIPFGIRDNFDVKFIPEELFLESHHVLELQDVFFLSFQPGIQRADRITPISRRGMVSVRNDDGTLYLDAFAFPGNSGSPVFIKPSALAFAEGTTLMGADPNNCKFVGLVGEYLPYQEVAVSAQTGKPRVVFEENTGLAKIWPVQSLLQLIGSPEFQTQHRRLKNREK